MFDRFRSLLFRFLRLPPEPEAPSGAPDSVRVFRAANNYFRFRLVGWVIAQFGTLAGIIISLGFLRTLDREIDRAGSTYVPAPGVEIRESGGLADAVPRPVADLAARTPDWVIPLISIAEVVGIAGFLLQIPLTFAAVRLDFELRWYMVTDRSLRIRSGIWKLNETTMSFANLQQVVVTQGPLQRLLSIADVRVQSAGGGGASSDHHSGREESLHVGIFNGVDNAHEIRDLIQLRLRRYREAGLGDPDDQHEEDSPAIDSGTGDLKNVAAELLGEARKLRELMAP